MDYDALYGMLTSAFSLVENRKKIEYINMKTLYCAKYARSNLNSKCNRFINDYRNPKIRVKDSRMKYWCFICKKLQQRMPTMKRVYEWHIQGSYPRRRWIKQGRNWGAVISRTRWRQLILICQLKWKLRSRYL